MHILVVDDVPVNRTLLTSLLTRKQHMVETATNGQEAVTAVSKANPPYDLVLMDIQMPVMDGCSATEAIRALPEPLGDTQVIAVTAHAMAGDRERYIGAGMNDYVSKPVRPGDLFSAIHRVMSRLPAHPEAKDTPLPDPKPPSQDDLLAATPLLDQSMLNQLHDCLDPEDLTDMFDLFPGQARLQADEIDAAIASGDPVAVKWGGPWHEGRQCQSRRATYRRHRPRDRTQRRELRAGRPPRHPRPRPDRADVAGPQRSNGVVGLKQADLRVMQIAGWAS